MERRRDRGRTKPILLIGCVLFGLGMGIVALVTGGNQALFAFAAAFVEQGSVRTTWG